MREDSPHRAIDELKREFEDTFSSHVENHFDSLRDNVCRRMLQLEALYGRGMAILLLSSRVIANVLTKSAQYTDEAYLSTGGDLDEYLKYMNETLRRLVDEELTAIYGYCQTPARAVASRRHVYTHYQPGCECEHCARLRLYTIPL